MNPPNSSASENSEGTGLSLPPPINATAAPSTDNNQPSLPPSPASDLTLSTSNILPTVNNVPTHPAADQTTPTTSVANDATIDTDSLSADDSDLIEKEWVTKAKEIVENTRNDPYEQTKKMTLFRADYMKKRYNKLIKSSE